MATPVNPDAWRPCQHGEIVDIGGLKSVQSLEQEFVQNLSSGQPLEKSVLYAHSNDWTEASKAQGYYQTYEELAIFDAHSKEILKLFSNGMTIIDIGAGSLEKAVWLLSKVEREGHVCTYIAIDINRRSLSQNIPTLAKKFDPSKLCIIGLHGTFDDGMKHCRQIPGPRLFLSLGSTICNKPYPQAVKDLQRWSDVLGKQDALLFGQDAHTIDYKEKIERAYHSAAFQDLIESFRDIANALAGKDVFSKDKWDLRCSFRTDSAGLCHVFMFVAKEDVHFGHTYTKGTTVDCFTSYKYDQQRVHGMCREAGMRVTNSWRSEFKMALYCIQTRHEPVPCDG